ncbi:nucleoside-triphosphatase [Lacrimispora indolis]|uniref:nucleoside-triphosphatase n=1 Tax=Lacrimispora indolis TaxID=69825 RepID=UPI00045EA9D9|nr:nucleoside-triphosphatase [Lacrimispora indolis]
MGKFLFLKGDSGEGKTTLLFECLRSWHRLMGGFYSQRLIMEDGMTMGFRMVPAEEDWIPAAPYKKGMTNVFIERTEHGFHKNPELFETVGVDILRSSAQSRLCLLDEIGGVELFVPEFMEEVLCCIDGPVPCIGVLKNRKNLESMRTRIPIQTDTDKLLLDLEEKLEKRSNGRILTFERDRKEHIRMEIMDFLRECGEKEGMETHGRKGLGL